MHPHDDEPIEQIDGDTPQADPYADAPTADPDADAESETALAEQASGSPRGRRARAPDPAPGTDSARRPRRRARRRTPTRSPPSPTTVAELVAATLRAAGVRIAFTVPGESFLAGARRARRGRHPDRRHAPRGRGGVRRRGLRPAHRPARRVPRHARSSGRRTSGSASTPPPPTPRRCSCSWARSIAASAAARRSRRWTSSGRSAGSPSGPGEIDDPATAAATLEAAVRATVEGRPGPGAARACPRTSWTCRSRRARDAPVVRPHPDVPNPDDVRAVLHFLAAPSGR